MNIFDLVVEPGREEHIARHHVSVEEVEQVTEGKPFITHTREGRYRLIGQTKAGRYLTIILVPRGQGIFSLVTARDADNSERRNYLRHKGR